MACPCIWKAQPVAQEGWVGGGQTEGRKIHGSGGRQSRARAATVQMGVIRTDGRNTCETDQTGLRPGGYGDEGRGKQAKGV